MTAFFLGDGYEVMDLGRVERDGRKVWLLKVQHFKRGCDACLAFGIPSDFVGLHESWIELPEDASMAVINAKLAEHKAAIEKHVAEVAA
jgi:hypothetical protein